LRGAAIGSWSAWSAVFAAVGPLLGGYILDVASWRWIFLINIPLVLICYGFGYMNIQESKDKRRRKVDIYGATLATLALGGITYGLIEGPVKNWGITALLPLAIGIICSVLFVWLEHSVKDPMV